MVVSQVRPQEGTQEGLRKTKFELCPMKKEAGILYHAEQQGRSGGRRGRRERKIKAGTFIGARKIRKGRIKFKIGQSE